MSASPDPTSEQAPRRIRRKTGPYAAADGRREAILDTAIAHFAQWGYFNSSMPKIAADVGMSRAGLLHHFDSKESLLAAVLQLREQRAADEFFLPLESAADAIALFRGIVAQTQRNETEPGLTQMFSVLAAEASNPEHPAHDYFRDRYINITRFLATTLQLAIEAGTIKADVDAEHTAQEILAVSDGFAVQWALAGPSYGLTQHQRVYLDRLARAITTTGEGLQ